MRDAGQGWDSNAVYNFIRNSNSGTNVVATTPHGTYTFGITNITESRDLVTIHLEEIKPPRTKREMLEDLTRLTQELMDGEYA